jgi:hypothetical protein
MHATERPRSKMYAAITQLRVLPGMFEEAQELFGSLVMPAYAERAARGAWIFSRAEEGAAIVVVLYETQQDAECGAEARLLDEMAERWAHALAEPPSRKVWQVTLAATTGAPLCKLSGDILQLLSQVTRAL